VANLLHLARLEVQQRLTQIDISILHLVFQQKESKTGGASLFEHFLSKII